ncbi:hypothetical protein V8F06_010056 [Rhypophila decipiens]
MATPDDSTGRTSRPHPLLEPINLHSQSQFDELLRQRKICGWSMTVEDVLTWRSEIDVGKQYFFWILHPCSDSPPDTEGQKQNVIYAGHITTSRLDGPSHPFLSAAGKTNGNPPDKVQYIGSLFILPEYRTLGLGRKAMSAIESLARVPPYGGPEIKALTLNCLSGRYIDDDSSEEWRPFAEKVYAKMGLPMPERGRSNQAWYASMGFKYVREKPSYSTGFYGQDGKEILFVAVAMRKDLN